jgi:Uma2 family endonuclease
MATASNAVMVPLQTYLDTVYRPDCDWIDGEVKERNMGEQPHASIQGTLTQLFRNNGILWKVRAYPEQRVQTSAAHYRIADLCIVRRDLPMEPIVRTPPILCVEILSRDDRMSEIQERVDDYLTMGVSTVWVIDPRRRRAYLALPHGAGSSMQQVITHLRVPETSIEVSLTEMFAELDELEAQ